MEAEREGGGKRQTKRHERKGGRGFQNCPSLLFSCATGEFHSGDGEGGRRTVEHERETEEGEGGHLACGDDDQVRTGLISQFREEQK